MENKINNKKNIKVDDIKENNNTENKKKSKKSGPRYTYICPQNSRLSKKGGWTILTLIGDPSRCGHTHGSLLKDHFDFIREAFVKIVEKDFKVTFQQYINKIIELGIDKMCENHYPDIAEEIKHISIGCDGKMSYIELIAWNHLLGMYSYYDAVNERCNAVIAFDNKGAIVMAHSTHSDYLVGMIQPYIFYVIPSKGQPFVMQSLPGYVFSGSDFFITTSGLIGCETTIAGFTKKPDYGTPLFCRARNMMQYARSADECINILMEKNSGDYACIWLLGDTNTKTIMKLELGRDIAGVYNQKKGFFHSANIPETKRLIWQETNLEETGRLNGGRDEILFNLMSKWNGTYEELRHIFSNNMLCKEENKRGKNGGSSDVKLVHSDDISSLCFYASWGSPCNKKMVIR
jgi:hypothetical protein